MTQRRKFSPEFKASVVLDLLLVSALVAIGLKEAQKNKNKNIVQLF